MSRTVTAGNTYTVQECTLCQTQGWVELEVPAYFEFMLGGKDRMELQVPCACERYAAWDQLPRHDIATAYANLSACMLGSATKFQWFSIIQGALPYGLEQNYHWEQHVNSTEYVRLGYTLWFDDINNPGTKIYWDGGAQTAPLPPMLYPSVMETVWQVQEDQESLGNGSEDPVEQYEIREVAWSEDRYSLVETGKRWSIQQVSGEDFYQAVAA